MYEGFLFLICAQMKIEELYKIFLDHRAICTDSRKIEAGDLFFALKGPNFNGNLFALNSLIQGAAYAVVDERIELKDSERHLEAQLLYVDDVLNCLQDLAKFHRKNLLLPLIGITGSNGKTTSKELIGSSIAEAYSTYITHGNLNNHIGVPLSVLSISDDHEIAIIEMGANHIGEIAFLCEICQPTHGLITNVGKAHLEGFGSIEGVKKGKSELYEYLERTGGIAFVNSNEPELMALSEQFKMIKLYYGETKNSIPSFNLELVQANPKVIIKWLVGGSDDFIVKSQLFGKYNYQNLLTAMFLAYYFKVPEPKIIRAIEQYNPTNNRSQTVSFGNYRVILDAYNANPSSMKLAIESFSKSEGTSNSVLILGDMFELGDVAEHEHRKIIEIVHDLGYKKVYLVGEIFSSIKDDEFKSFEDVESLIHYLDYQEFDPTNKTTFLIKGSRGVKLEKALQSRLFSRKKA